MRNLRKPYQMYVLNLDAGRIFWITTILLLLLALSFFAGLLVGKEKAKTEMEIVSDRNKKIVEELLSRVEEKGEDETEYEFYDLMKPQPDKYRETISPSEIPESSEERVKPEEKVAKPKTYEPYIQLGDNRISSRRPYTIQVASYKKYKNAKLLKDYLESEQYPVYIIKSKVNGSIYYRVRVGPFASKALTIKVLEQLRSKRGCESSFITSK